MKTILYLVPALLFLYLAWGESLRQLHMAQLEGYKPSQYLHWLKHNKQNAFFKNHPLMKPGSGDAPKKPLVFTNRAKRLFVINSGLLLAWMGLSYLLSVGPLSFVFLLMIAGAFIPLIMLLATRIAYPMEMRIQKGYYRDAQKKIGTMANLRVIGITGSYGKTSTKYFLKTILSEKYNTLMTPESYNTPMGITRVIREQLTAEHEVFVCEMGARNVGDIRELVELAKPTIGIISSIGAQHLETFKSVENIKNTKNELIEGLPPGGTAVFNGDNEHCVELAARTALETLMYSIENHSEDMAVYADAIVTTEKGLCFTVHTRDGLSFPCQTELLGKHNVSNILAAVCVALKLDLTVEQIQGGVRKIKPVPHRLQLIPTANGVIVIDDAFNSNPAGAKEALDTIRELGTGKRIVITPGMVELGAVEAEENKAFGRAMADSCDYAILVGLKRSQPIAEGLREGGFPEDRILVTANLNEATTKMGQIVKAGDVVLFENDLPDNYNE